MKRRQFLGVFGVGSVTALAGCPALETESRSVRSPPLVADRPEAVYVPTHVEGMQMVDVVTAGRLGVALSYSFPHRFWLVTGDRTNKVAVGADDSAHTMVSVWDRETGRAVPSSNASLTVTRDGETVQEKTMWRMLSQNMGFHYGDNVQLPAAGTYEVTVDFGPVGTRTTGAFRGAFDERVSPTFTLQFDPQVLDDLRFQPLSDRQGSRGAVEPMRMERLPVSQLPVPADLPGPSLGTATTGDVTVAATLLDAPPAGVDESGRYLAVSPRTPYNRYPIPSTSFSAVVTRDGETVHDGQLTPTLDPDLGYHHGATAEVAAGDTVTVTLQTPPQVARHEGYETAFFDASPAELTVGES